MKYNIELSFEELLLIRVSLKDRQRFEEYLLDKAKQEGNEKFILVCNGTIENIKHLIDRIRPYTDFPSSIQQ